jgi:tetratricopeptide (TPR) repeat protein
LRTTATLPLIAIFCALSVSGVSAEKAVTGASLRRQADTLRREKKYAEAEKLYLRALTISKEVSEKVRIYQSLSLVGRSQKDAQKQILYLKKAKAVAKAMPQLQAQISAELVSVLKDAGKHKEAENFARRAMKTAPSTNARLSLWNQVCQVHKKLNTLSVLEKECRLRGRKPALEQFLKLKAVYEAMGNKSKLTELNKKIVVLYPDDEMACRDLSKELVAWGNSKEAVPILEKLASKPGPDRRKIAEHLAVLSLKNGDEAAATKWLTVLKAPDAATYRRIIRILVDAGKTEMALKEFDEAISNSESVDDHYRLRIEKAKLMVKNGQKEKAQIDLKTMAAEKACPEHLAEEAKRIK